MAAKVSDEPPSLPPKISQGNGAKSSKGFFRSKTKRSQSFPPLSSSASAQELRCLEAGNEKKDNESSPKGVIEACMSNGENEPKSSESNRSQAVVCSPNPRGQSGWNKFFKMWKRKNLIGKGGCAEVYKGCLADGRFIAVKRMNKGSLEDREENFLSEVGTIAHVDHPNTAKMIGYGVEGGAYLVLKLSSKGSLGSLLRAKWLPKEWTHHNVSNFEGTFGYFAPEYFMHGIVDEKTDVYAFGVLLLEIITGRPAVDESQKSIVLWVVTLLGGDNNDNNDGSKENQKRALQRTYSEELFDAEEYNLTKYLNDLERHQQLALDS
nr:receptor-like cytosolic serine/threonine-protein kinase RBK2 isoform X1 [Ipomoea batatas]